MSPRRLAVDTLAEVAVHPLRSGRWAGVAAVVLGVAAPFAPGAAQTRNFSNYGARQGLPQAQVRTILEDRRAYVWLGTYGGITRFDGLAFHTYTTADGLRSNAVTALAEDSRGRLVVGMLGGGICVGMPSAFRCSGASEGLPADVRAVLPDERGGVWVATEKGVAHVDSAGRVHRLAMPDGGERLTFATQLARDERGVLWAGTAGGLLYLDGDRFVPHADARVRSHSIGMLVSLPLGLLAGVDSRVVLVRGNQVTPFPGLDPEPAGYTDAALDAAGVLWLATRKGAVRFDGKSGRTERLTADNGLVGDDINDVLLDREGNLWLGTESGLSKLTPGPFDHLTVREGLPNRFVRALAEDVSGRLWAGTRDGLAVWEGSRFRPVSLAGAPDRRIYSIAPLADGSLLIGTRGGLLLFKGSVRRHYGVRDGLPNEFVLSVRADPLGGAWVGTSGGMVRWESGRVVPARDSLLSQAVAVAMEYDGRGRLWIGARSGGVLIHGPGGTTTLSARDGLSDQTVWSLARDPAGNMWVATNGDGAFSVAPDGRLQRYTTANGLPNDFVWQALADLSGNVWFSTNLGLARLTRGRLERYGRAEGLVELEGTANAALQDRAGVLWFGTGSGVTRYRAAFDRPSVVRPPAYIEAVSAGFRPLGLADVRVPPGAGAVRIQFSAPSYRAPEMVRFSYRLLGRDDSWSAPTPERTVAFGGLAPGRYVFEVRAINEAGLESERPATLAFTVSPRFWQTWWFQAIGVLLIVAIVATVPYLRSLRQERERRRLEALVTQHTDRLQRQTVDLEREVAERIAAEEELRKSEERLREIVEHSTNLFYSRTPDHVLTYVSPQSRDFLGVSPEEAHGRWTEFATENPVNAAGLAATERALATGQQQPPYELELRRPDGAHIWVEVNEAPVVRDGKAVAMVGSLTNITEAKLAHEKEAALQARLRESQKLEAIGRLAGGIAHDFNNLLTAIIGGTEMLAGELPPGGRPQEDVAEIRRAADRAASLVAQLLAFSRRQLVQRRSLDLNTVVADAARMIQRVMGTDVTVEVSPMQEPAWVLADHSQLDQILLNLAANARDAMPTGGRFSIATEYTHTSTPLSDDTPAGDYILLVVRDDGEGMDAATMARVFEPFFTTKATGKGVGLGLAMVYGIVKQNDGHIAIDSALGRGTTLRIYLPRATPPADAVTPPASDAAGTVGAAREVVLVVEDEEPVRKLVSRILTRAGYRVLEAANGDAALAMSAEFKERIHVLLTDIIMPGLSGKQVATRITAQRPDTGVLFMSGHAREQLGARGIITEDGIRVLQKPFGPHELTQRVRDVIAAS